jgi:hypothetical protein
MPQVCFVVLLSVVMLNLLTSVILDNFEVLTSYVNCCGLAMCCCTCAALCFVRHCRQKNSLSSVLESDINASN